MKKNNETASLSARRAWIEIESKEAKEGPVLVALRKESVDRNIAITYIKTDITVALRKESVDRNHVVLVVPGGCWVALRKESVDRNLLRILSFSVLLGRSPQGERG